LIPIENTPFGELDAPSSGKVNQIRSAASEYIAQMRHCARCRADAVGMLGHANSQAINEALKQASHWDGDDPAPTAERPYVAVATMEGVLVNQHLGMCGELSIYNRDDDGNVTVVDQRVMPKAGTGGKRWEALADMLGDCRAIVASGIGQGPRSVFETTPIRIVETEGMVEETLEKIYTGGALLPVIQMSCATSCSMSSSCGGTPGMGCG
jgi:nitrogen fixation protein NifB